jgi:uncharacterized protein YuzE
VRLEYIGDEDAAYIYLKEIGDGESARTVLVEDRYLAGDIIIDLDRDGRVLGFEFPSQARSMLPDELFR